MLPSHSFLLLVLRNYNRLNFVSILVSLEVLPAKKYAGKLYELDLTGETDLLSKDPLLENAADIQATADDLSILDDSGVVFLFITKANVLRELSFPGKVVKITAGVEHSACLLEDGQVFIWGSFENPGYMFRDPYVPVRIMREHTIVDIASGRDHFVALNNVGEVLTMGCGAEGQLGRLSARVAVDGGRKGNKLIVIIEYLQLINLMLIF